jgi:hypothetical protein
VSSSDDEGSLSPDEDDDDEVEEASVEDDSPLFSPGRVEDADDGHGGVTADADAGSSALAPLSPPLEGGVKEPETF